MATSDSDADDYDRTGHPDVPHDDGYWVDERFLDGPAGYDY